MKYYKICITSLLGFLVLFMAIPSGIAQSISIYMNEEKIEYSVSPYIENGTTMVPMRTIFEHLGAEVSWDEDTKTVTAMKDFKTMKLTIGSETAYINHVQRKLDVAPVIVHSSTMVPLRFIGESFGARVVWLADTKSVYVDTDTIVDEKDSYPELKFETAWQQIMHNSTEYKDKEYSVERAQEVRDRAGLNLGSAYATGPGFGLEDLQKNQIVMAVKSADASLRIAKKELEITKEQLSNRLYSLFLDIKQNEQEVEMINRRIANADRNMQIAEIQKKHGVQSTFNVNNISNTLKQEKQKKTIVEKTVDTAYLKLNEMIAAEEPRYALQYVIDWAPLQEFDIEQHIRTTRQVDPYLFMLKERIELANMGVDLYVYNAGQEPFRAKEIDVVKANLDLHYSRSKYDEVIRIRYNQLLQIAEQYELLELNVARAKDQLELLQSQFALGLIIESQLHEAQLGIEELKFEQFKIAINYLKLIPVLEKPFLAPEYMQ